MKSTRRLVSAAHASLALALAVSAGACSRQDAQPAAASGTAASGEPPATAPGAPPALPEGWCAFGVGRVHFHAPCELEDERPQGIDSLVGAWHSDALRIDFDFGWYSDDSFGGRYDGRTLRDGVLESTTVGTRPARLASWTTSSTDTDHPHVVALYVPDVDGTGAEPGETKLSFNVACRDAADVPAARRIVESVWIEPRNAPQDAAPEKR